MEKEKCLEQCREVDGCKLAIYGSDKQCRMTSCPAVYQRTYSNFILGPVWIKTCRSDCSDIQLFVSSLDSRLGYFQLLDVRSGKDINDCIKKCLNTNGCRATYYNNKCLLLSRSDVWVDMISRDILHEGDSASMVEMKCNPESTSVIPIKSSSSSTSKARSSLLTVDFSFRKTTTGYDSDMEFTSVLSVTKSITAIPTKKLPTKSSRERHFPFTPRTEFISSVLNSTIFTWMNKSGSFYPTTKSILAPPTTLSFVLSSTSSQRSVSPKDELKSVDSTTSLTAVTPMTAQPASLKDLISGSEMRGSETGLWFTKSLSVNDITQSVTVDFRTAALLVITGTEPIDKRLVSVDSVLTPSQQEIYPQERVSTAKKNPVNTGTAKYINPCHCSTGQFLNKTSDEIIRNIAENITIDAKLTKASRAKKQCLEDSRVSSSAIGYVTAVVLCIVIGLIIVMDCSKILGAFVHLRF